MTVPNTPLWINGERRPASDGETYEVRNFLTKELVGIAASATSEDCEDAVQAAANALDSWERLPGPAKRAIFLKAADLYVSEKYTKKFTEVQREETGASDIWIKAITGPGRLNIIEAASLATQIKGEAYPAVNAPGGHAVIYRKPHGAILSIPTWNASVVLCFRSILVPLICGNTIVLKSNEYCPRAHEAVVELMHEAGLPPGVLNLISTSRDNSPKLTAELIGHRSIRHVNFTGSDRIGKIIASTCALHLKQCVLELGGKNPSVVLSDANTSLAARGIAQGALANSGQVCMSTDRVIVQRPADQTLLPSLQALFAKIRAGNSNSELGSSLKENVNVRLAPLLNEVLAENVVEMMREAKAEGAEVLTGDLTREGAVVQPHILLGVKPGMRAWNQESFGPVIMVNIVDTVEEAIEMANATNYSLNGAVWTRDINRGLDVGFKIRVGNVSVNGSTFHTEPALGTAGLGGSSGYGRFDIDHFTVKRMVVIHPTEPRFPLVDDL